VKILSIPVPVCAELARRLAEVTLEQSHQAGFVGLHKAFACLPDDILLQVFHFGRDPTSPGIMLLEGLPIDAVLPETPIDAGDQRGSIAALSEKTLLGLAQLIGTPVGYLSEKDGSLIHHIVPMPGGEYTQSNRGSRVFLSYHNDSMYDASGIFNSHNPDFLLLLCLRADAAGEAKTMFADARGVTERLDEDIRQVLRQSRFRMAAPSNYTLLIRQATSTEKIWSQPVPILSGPADLPEIYIAANGVEALDAEAEKALHQLLDVCQEVGEQFAVQLRPGQALLINNRKGVHARTEFSADYNGKDRWLLRANIRTSLWNIRDRTTRQAMVFA
jgi:L-asparagine oxygenase